MVGLIKVPLPFIHPRKETSTIADIIRVIEEKVKRTLKIKILITKKSCNIALTA